MLSEKTVETPSSDVFGDWRTEIGLRDGDIKLSETPVEALNNLPKISKSKAALTKAEQEDKVQEFFDQIDEKQLMGWDLPKDLQDTVEEIKAAKGAKSLKEIFENPKNPPADSSSIPNNKLANPIKKEQVVVKEKEKEEYEEDFEEEDDSPKHFKKDQKKKEQRVGRQPFSYQMSQFEDESPVAISHENFHGEEDIGMDLKVNDVLEPHNREHLPKREEANSESDLETYNSDSEDNALPAPKKNIRVLNSSENETYQDEDNEEVEFEPKGRVKKYSSSGEDEVNSEEKFAARPSVQGHLRPRNSMGKAMDHRVELANQLDKMQKNLEKMKKIKKEKEDELRGLIGKHKYQIVMANVRLFNEVFLH